MASAFVPNLAVPALMAASHNMRDEMAERGQKIAELAEDKAPLGPTGDLKASISATTVFEGAIWKARISADVPYAAFVEYGTIDTPQQAFLRPAADEVIG